MNGVKLKNSVYKFGVLNLVLPDETNRIKISEKLRYLL